MPKEDNLVQIESRHIGGTRVVDVSISFPSCSQPATIVKSPLSLVLQTPSMGGVRGDVEREKHAKNL